MQTRILRAGADGLLAPQELAEICGALAANETVALPTETVYGLAANALSAEACTKIFAAKERPFTDPLICHVPGAEAMEELARPCGLARDLAQAFWPGPLTLVLPKKQVIPDLITAGQPTVALRCSAHPLFQQVVIRCGFPLAAPSANRFGRISPTTAAAVVEELDGRIGWLADGGACGHGVESTIVAVGEKELRILRPGPVGEKELAAFAPLREAAAGELAPGRLPWHYAPQTTLRILPGGGMAEVPTGARKGLLAWSKPPPDGDWAAIEHLSLTGGNMVEAAHRLYECLRRLDAAGLEILWAEPLPDEGLGRVIMDRLRKAAARG